MSGNILDLSEEKQLMNTGYM